MMDKMEFGSPSPDARDATVAMVVGNAQAFRGMLVRLEGWITLEFENIAIYPSVEWLCEWYSSKQSRGTRQSLWLVVNEVDGLQGGVLSLQELLKKYGKSCSGSGIVEGIVDPTYKGHRGIWPAALSPLRRLVLGTSKNRWPDFDWEALEAERERVRAEERRRWMSTAEGVLAGRINVVDAVREITKQIWFSSDELQAGDAALLDKIVSAGVSIPPPHARLNCSGEFLARIEIQIAAIDATYGDDLRALCSKLLAARNGL